jgi:D-threo-aldose 1-dehydrogenase
MDLKNDAVQDISYQGILNCYEQGNTLLGGKYFPQLASVHDPDEYLNAATSWEDRDQRFANIVEAYKALAFLKASGRVKAIGVGAKDWKIIQEISKEVELDWVMFANSMTIMHHPKDLLDFMQSLHGKNISIVNSAVFHAGFLIGGQFFDYRLIRPDTEENKAIFRWREDFFALCAKHGISPAVACVSFATTAPGVVSIALNTSKPLHIKSNVASVVTKVPAAFWAVADVVPTGSVKHCPHLRPSPPARDSIWDQRRVSGRMDRKQSSGKQRTVEVCQVSPMRTQV